MKLLKLVPLYLLLLFLSPLSTPAENPEYLHFWDKSDIHDTYGRITFHTEPLRKVGRTKGYPCEMIFGCTAPRPAGGHYVYCWTCRDPNGKFHETNPLKIYRCWTEDALNFHDVELVFGDTHRKWLGFANLVRRESDGTFFLFPWARDPNKFGHCLLAYSSSNGADWQLLTDRAYHDHDAFCVFWDSASQQFINVQTTYQPYPKKYPDNITYRRRVLSVRTTRDGLHWSPPDNVGFGGPFRPVNQLITPDNLDPPELELYRVCAFPFLDRYVALVNCYASLPQIANPRAGTLHAPGLGGQWAFSTNGIHWIRPDRFDYTAATPETGGMPLQAPLRYNDTLYFYGPNYDPNGQIISTIYHHRIFYTFCRANAEFSTLPFTLDRHQLLLNFSALGSDSYLMAELRDRHGNTIPGFEKQNCLITQTDHHAFPLQWKNQSLDSLENQPVYLRFYFRNARLYSLRIAPLP